MSVPLSWAGAGSDFFVYYPETTSKRLTFLMTTVGLWLAFILVNIIGVGLAAGTLSNSKWDDAYKISPGALILQGFDGLGGFGKFCAVVIALGTFAGQLLCFDFHCGQSLSPRGQETHAAAGTISNNVPGTYAAALDAQVLGRVFKMVPRWLWVCVMVLIYTVCGIAGREHLLVIFQVRHVLA